MRLHFRPRHALPAAVAACLLTQAALAQTQEPTAGTDETAAAQDAPQVPENEASVALDEASDAAPEAADLVERWRAAPRTIFSADEVVLADLQFIARPLIVMANSPNDPLVRQQLGLIEERFSELVDRDVIVVLDTSPESNTEIRAELRPRGFSMVLIGKDGRVALRKPAPWSVREIVNTIDRLPIRQQELRGG